MKKLGKHKYTVLLRAALQLQENILAEVVPVLIKLGAQVNAVTAEDKTSLFFAAYKGNHMLINLLIQNGANIQHKDKNNNIALHFASTKEVAQVLIEAGLDINAKNKKARKYSATLCFCFLFYYKFYRLLS